jgi:hypothetical protein
MATATVEEVGSVPVQLWDTCSEKHMEYLNLQFVELRNAEVLMLVFDVRQPDVI